MHRTIPIPTQPLRSSIACLSRVENGRISSSSPVNDGTSALYEKRLVLCRVRALVVFGTDPWLRVACPAGAMSEAPHPPTPPPVPPKPTAMPHPPAHAPAPHPPAEPAPKAELTADEKAKAEQGWQARSRYCLSHRLTLSMALPICADKEELRKRTRDRVAREIVSTEDTYVKA